MNGILGKRSSFVGHVVIIVNSSSVLGLKYKLMFWYLTACLAIVTVGSVSDGQSNYFRLTRVLTKHLQMWRL